MESKNVLTIKFKITRKIQADQKFVFDWWTDLSSDDSKLVKPLKSRKIISRTNDNIVLEDEEEMYFKRMKFDVTVALYPPDLWVSEYSGKSASARSEYRLISRSPEETTLMYSTEIEPSECFVRAFSLFVKPFVRHVFASEMTVFISALEEEFRKKIAEGGSS